MSKRIIKGTKAPQFETTDVFDNKVSLAEGSNQYTLLVFLRYAGCPFCNLALHRLVLEQELLKKERCRIIAFLQSSKENITENIYKRHKHTPEFPIVADEKQEFYELYGVKTSVKALAKSITKIPYWIHSVRDLGFKQAKIDGNLLTVPALFLVSEGQQKILYANYSSSFYDSETFTDIYQKILFPFISD